MAGISDVISVNQKQTSGCLVGMIQSVINGNRNPEEKITPAMHRTAPALLEALRDCRESLEAALEHITKDGVTDEHEELYYLGIAASDNAKAALAAAEGAGDTHS